MGLYEELKRYGASGVYPFHMPGHKRRMGEPREACGIDITEIDGFDDLHHAEGVLREAQGRAARLYGAGETYFLINGSTAGILAAISACVRPGGKLLMARVSHLAAYHAAQIRGLRTVYLYPAGTGYGSIRPEDVRAALQRDREIEAVFLTSPTYEGVVSDVGRIAAAAHEFGVPLIVDEAHGAHFGFHPYFPESSVHLGADIVIHSVHKTLPSLTQTALLHRSGRLTDGGAVQKYLSIYQSSSPSYVLMASIDACVGLLREKGRALFDAFAARLEDFYEAAGDLRHIHLARAPKAGEDAALYARDPSKLILSADGHTGTWLAGELRRRFSLELEMAAGGYAVALTSLADTQEGFDRLLAALRQLDTQLEEPAPAEGGPRGPYEYERPKQALFIAEADLCPQVFVPLEESAGEISAEYVYLYPPGVPLLVPGERVSGRLLSQMQGFRAAQLTLRGMERGGFLKICRPDQTARGRGGD